LQRYSFSVELRIWHPTIDPAIITGKLGLKPKYTSMAGDPRQTPQGRPLGGTYAESYWHADPFERGEYSSTDDLAEDALASVVETLDPSKQFLLLLREQGARIHLQVSSFSGRNYAIELSPQFLLSCANLGISVVHDVYPYAQNW
jgi:hypothetical protein